AARCWWTAWPPSPAPRWARRPWWTCCPRSRAADPAQDVSEHLDEKPVSFASILEEKTRDQAVASSRMPFIFPHLALMPDAHLGMGATVGSVIPTLGASRPAAGGGDSGGGEEAGRTGGTAGDRPGHLA